MCELTQGRSRICKTNIGGISKVWIAKHTPFARNLIVRDGLVLVSIPQTFVYEFEPMNKPKLTQTMNEKDGNKSYDQSISIDLTQSQYHKFNDLKNLLNSDWFLLLQDNLGNVRFCGAYNGLRCKIKYNSGNTIASLNGFTLDFEGEEVDEALFVEGDLADGGFIVSDFILLEDGNFVLQDTATEDLIELE